MAASSASTGLKNRRVVGERDLEREKGVAAKRAEKTVQNVEPKPMMTEFRNRSPKFDGPAMTMSYAWTMPVIPGFPGGFAARKFLGLRVRW